MAHESSSSIAHEVRELEFQLSEAKAQHGKTLLLLNKAAFETIPGLESTVTVLREQNGKLREALLAVQPFAEKELECREMSCLPGPLNNDEEFYLTEAQDAVEAIRAALEAK